MRQHVTDYLSDHNISFSAKQTMFWEALYELYRAPMSGLLFKSCFHLCVHPFLGRGLGTRRLCWHNNEHNRCLKALSIMLA